jgi:lipopolysaccharide transport protein LptA
MPGKAKTLIVAALLLGPALAISATPQLGSEDINIAADMSTFDPRNDLHVLTGNVRVTQGDMSIASEQATAKGVQTDHSSYTFEKNVVIRSATAELKSDSANAVFAGGRIAEATVRGKPATFEQRGVTSDKNVQGRANVIVYDFGKGTVTLTQDVWFSYGGNQASGDTVVYSLRDQRVVVNPTNSTSSQGNGRVNITIRPGSGIVLPGTPQKRPPSDESEKTEKKE